MNKVMFFNADYLKKFKEDKINNGWEGFLLHNSKVDGTNHDVWIIFDPSRLELKGKL